LELFFFAVVVRGIVVVPPYKSNFILTESFEIILPFVLHGSKAYSFTVWGEWGLRVFEHKVLGEAIDIETLSMKRLEIK
jgi:hypothetical protein